MKIPSSDTSSQENSSELRLPKILLLEGKDEELLIGKLLKQMNIADVQCIDIEGKPQFPPTIRALRRRTGFEKIVMVGLVADADTELASSTFDSLKYHLQKAEFIIPDRLAALSSGSPQIGIFVLPDNHRQGMLEDLCLESISQDSLSCVDDFMRCSGIESQDIHFAKRRALAFLATSKGVVNQVGLAAQKSIWNFDHPCFDGLKAFLKQFR